MKRNGQMTEKEANLVFDILVEHCGSPERERDEFVFNHAEGVQG